MTRKYIPLRCPECGTVRAFGKTLLDTDEWWEMATETPRMCSCGFAGDMSEFNIRTQRTSASRQDESNLSLRLLVEGAVIRAIRGIHSVQDHDHRWSRHPRPLCIDCGAAQAAEVTT